MRGLKRKPRVMHILEATLGGTRRYLANIIAAHADCEEILVYSSLRCDSSWSDVLDAARKAGWHLLEVPMTREIDPKHDWNAFVKIRKVMREFRPDVIHAHSSKAGALGRLAACTLFPKPKVLYSPHALALRINRVFLLIERLLAPLTTRFIAVSPSESQEIIENHLAKGRHVSIVAPAVPIEDWQPRSQLVARAALHLPAEGDLVVAVGRLTPQKDPLAFVRLIEILVRSRPSLRAYWVGDGEMHDEFLAAILARGLMHTISLSGWTSNVHDYIASASVVVSLSRYESFGYVMPEAMAMARPVVAAAVTGIVDILDDRLAGATFSPGDIISAAAKIEYFLDNAPARETFVRDAHSKVQDAYSLDAMRKALDELYSFP